MLGPGRATFEGTHAHVRDAIHEPKGLQQPRIPILVGGNGPKVTWRLAARFADELNLDALPPAQVEAALPVIAERCAEVGRDPATLAVSVHIWGEAGAVAPGAERRQRLRDYAISACTGSSSRASPSQRTRVRLTTSSTMRWRSGSSARRSVPPDDRLSRLVGRRPRRSRSARRSVGVDEPQGREAERAPRPRHSGRGRR